MLSSKCYSRSLCLGLFIVASSLCDFAQAKSIARRWDDMLLQSVRYDLARPTVTARNLFHMSTILYDCWAIYDSTAPNYYVNFKRVAPDVVEARRITTSYAAFRFIRHRFAKAPKADKIVAETAALMNELGLDPNYQGVDESPAGTGNLIAQMVIERDISDGSLEEQNYQSPPEIYAPLNAPLVVKLPGFGDLKNVNFWQPLALDFIIDQGGNPLPNNIQVPLTLHWGSLPPFVLDASDRNPLTRLYLDPGPPPEFNGVGHDVFRESMERVIEVSSWLDASDGVTVDISPSKIGNNALGTNDGQGHDLNPLTGATYEPNVVLRGDYARVLAEFWADGPQSETPPGHWNVIANTVFENPKFKRRWMGQGPELPEDEWDVKFYLTLNGALYDASIMAWGLKGYYQGSRPISAIRYMGSLGQSSDPKLPSYNPLGFKLRPGLIELVTPELTQPGEKFAHLVGYEGKIALRNWQGAPSTPMAPNRGVGWMLAQDWLPYQKPTFVTPPFPGYISGHSTFSRAAAEVMTALTGSKYFPGGVGQYSFASQKALSFEHGPTKDVTLQWATYYDAADQCSLSRILGGIHGPFDDFPGRRAGSVIGKKAVAKMNRFFKN